MAQAMQYYGQEVTTMGSNHDLLSLPRVRAAVKMELQAALDAAAGNLSQAARDLGWDRRTLLRYCQRWLGRPTGRPPRKAA